MVMKDTKYGKNWHIVQTFDHRHLYNVPESEGVLYNAPAYQDECCEDQLGRKGISEFTSEQPLNRENEPGTSLDATEIALLMEQEDRHNIESDSDAERDDTLMAYYSENEIEPEVVFYPVIPMKLVQLQHVHDNKLHNED
ncbi:hypothetical protein EJB05_13130, partial [Eragrostis curvula]